MSKRSVYEAKAKAAQQFRKTAHVFKGKIISWWYCTGCGLVALNNEATGKRIQQPCESMED